MKLAARANKNRVGERDARLAAWIINGARTAVWSENFRGIEIDDLFDPDPMTKEDADRQRESLSQSLPSTLD